MSHLLNRAVFYIGGVLLALAATGAPAGAETLPTFLKRLEAVSKKTRTLEARFTQVKHLTLFQSAVSTKGLMRFRQPGDLRWETLPPDQSLLLLVKDKAELRLPGEKPRALHLDQGSALSLLMQQVLIWLGVKPAKNLTSQYHVTLKQNKDGTQLLLKPKKGPLQKRISSLTFQLSSDLLLQHIKIIQKDGDRMEIIFDTMKRNVQLPKNSFH